MKANLMPTEFKHNGLNVNGQAILQTKEILLNPWSIRNGCYFLTRTKSYPNV